VSSDSEKGKVRHIPIVSVCPKHGAEVIAVAKVMDPSGSSGRTSSPAAIRGNGMVGGDGSGDDSDFARRWNATFGVKVGQA